MTTQYSKGRPGQTGIKTLDSGPVETQRDERAYSILSTVQEPEYDNHLERLLGPRDFVRSTCQFYILADMSIDSPKALELYRKYSRKMAMHITNYIVMAALGEARHAHGFKMPQKSFSPLANAIITVQSWHPLTRDGVWERGAALLHAGYSSKEILTACVEIFERFAWGAHYGGPKWAKIARMPMTAETSAILVDNVIDLLHNCGWALNKYYEDAHRCRRHSLMFDSVLKLREALGVQALAKMVCLDRDIAILAKRLWE